MQKEEAINVNLNNEQIEIQDNQIIEQEEIDNTYEVTRVVDGDTIEIDYNGEKRKVRLIGINTPESVKPNSPIEEYGKEASDFTKEKLTDKMISLEFDIQKEDKYGRMLAYVYLDDKMFNMTLLEEGYAQVATYPPNIKYVDKFIILEKAAREAEKGLWSLEK
jgi:endonuclease YncB( thermonuclease family)